ncbi:RING-H2 finger protein atl29 [Phtheirospermum japonicum]|uniref:RING-H2 finger protein atl29 n=1 Tax=Phtheirospermum japonicum TaxID=374723 RepID=A0A830CGS1_9LAMI|nr:RING-H2 finger protein atl29 [Phtheirospermum japonicum]
MASNARSAWSNSKAATSFASSRRVTMCSIKSALTYGSSLTRRAPSVEGTSSRRLSHRSNLPGMRMRMKA